MCSAGSSGLEERKAAGPLHAYGMGYLGGRIDVAMRKKHQRGVASSAACPVMSCATEHLTLWRSSRHVQQQALLALTYEIGQQVGLLQYWRMDEADDYCITRSTIRTAVELRNEATRLLFSSLDRVETDHSLLLLWYVLHWRMEE